MGLTLYLICPTLFYCCRDGPKSGRVAQKCRTDPVMLCSSKVAGKQKCIVFRRLKTLYLPESYSCPANVQTGVRSLATRIYFAPRKSPLSSRTIRISRVEGYSEGRQPKYNLYMVCDSYIQQLESMSGVLSDNVAEVPCREPCFGKNCAGRRAPD